jgi:surface polysaccharide O-acyltransferase-like enzyme
MKIDPEEQKLVNDEKKININTEVINPINNQNEEIKIKEKPKIRNSSFELLRIILMILIILSHIIYFTKSLPKLDKKNYQKIINNNYIFLRIISNNGKIGDIIFIMISGYFSVKRLDFHYYKFILIATETYTYHYLFLYISFKLIPIYKDISPLQQKKGSMYLPLNTSLGHWFTQIYLLLLIFMPFINSGLLSLSHQKYKTLVILIIIFYCILKGTMKVLNIETNTLYASLFIRLLLPYIIGGYIRIVDLKYKLFWKISGIIFFILTFIFEFIFEKLAVYYDNYIWISIQDQLSNNIYSLLPILSSIGIICLFKDIEIYNKKINFISASVLGIYLIHANKNIAPFLYNAWYKTNDYNENNFFRRYFIKTILIFIVSLIIDIIRRFTIGFIIEIVLKYFIKKFKNKFI